MKSNAIQKWQMVLFLLFVLVTSNAQETSSTSTNLSGQFDYILTKSESYRDLQIVKRKWIENLKESVFSSYTSLETQFLESKAMMQKQQREIESLKTKLQQANASLATYTNKGPTVTFLGIAFNQIVFGTLFSILFFGSLILACVFAIKYNKSNELTLNAKNVLAELEEEFQEYKRKTIEREQKISRQLQDELNKQKQFIKMKAS